VGGGRGLQSLTQRRRIHREDIRTLGPESQLGPYGQACGMGVPHPSPPPPSPAVLFTSGLHPPEENFHSF
jgi:hypothetical protein